MFFSSLILIIQLYSFTDPYIFLTISFLNIVGAFFSYVVVVEVSATQLSMRHISVLYVSAQDLRPEQFNVPALLS